MVRQEQEQCEREKFHVEELTRDKGEPYLDKLWSVAIFRFPLYPNKNNGRGSQISWHGKALPRVSLKT